MVKEMNQDFVWKTWFLDNVSVTYNSSLDGLIPSLNCFPTDLYRKNFKKEKNMKYPPIFACGKQQDPLINALMNFLNSVSVLVVSGSS